MLNVGGYFGCRKVFWWLPDDSGILFLADLALFKEPAIGCILLKKSYKKTRLTAGFLHMSQS